jgi:hypothetical protein
LTKKGSNWEKFALAGAVISFLFSAVFIKLSGFSVASLVNYLGTIIRQGFVGTAGLNTFGAVHSLAAYLFFVITGLVFLVLAYSFASAYGYYEERKKTGLLLSLVGGIIFFFMIGFTLASAGLALGVFISCFVIMPLANTYGHELRRWIHFRVGSNTISRSLFILNIVIALAVFFSVLFSLASYQIAFRDDLKSAITDSVKSSIPTGIISVDASAVDSMISGQVDASLSSPIFTAYFRWLPVISAFSVWAVLEFLRLFLPYLAGAFTAAIVRTKA